MWINRYILTLHPCLSSLYYHVVGGNCTTSISAYYFVLLLSTFLRYKFCISCLVRHHKWWAAPYNLQGIFADLVPTYVTTHRLVLRSRVIFGNIFLGKNATHVVGNVVICPKI